MPMIIVSSGSNLSRWIDALKRAGPGIGVFMPDEIKDKASVRFALSWNHPHGIFREFPNLVCISSFGAGADHILSDPHIPEHIEVVRIIDPLLSSDMAEFTLTVIMSSIRRMPVFWQQKQTGVWKKHRYRRITETRIGVMGTGMIGHHVATILKRTGFQVSGWSRTKKSDPASYAKYHGREQLPEFLGMSDFLVCLLPLTPLTRGIVNKELLDMLPPEAFLINLGRGSHVVEADLLGSIDRGHVSGAHLDVFDTEPLPPSHPYWSHPAIEITPHVASLTDPTSVAPQIIENYQRLMDGKKLLNTVSRKLGY